MTSGHSHFFAAPGALDGDRVRLEGEEARHASRVLRIRAGETISVADGTGRVADAVVVRSSADSMDARVILVRSVADAVPALTLYQGLARRERMDVVVQKAVEVGARAIVAFGCERSVARWDDDKGGRALTRWRAVALAASKQCRSARLTDVTFVRDASCAAASIRPPAIVLAPQAPRTLREVLPADPPPQLAVVVGPEGGLAPAELEAFVDGGAIEASLGQRILRTETAGPVALALAAYSYGNLG